MQHPSLARVDAIEFNPEVTCEHLSMLGLHRTAFLALTVSWGRTRIITRSFPVARDQALRMATMVGRKDLTNESRNDEESNRFVVHVYPYGRLPPEVDPKRTNDSPYSHSKILHAVRHAQGYHNVNDDHHNLEYLDARLTDYGKEQCHALAKRIRAGQDPSLQHLALDLQLVVTSPLTRTMQTALLSLQPVLSRNNGKPNVVAHEQIRETVNYNCDRRRPISELKNEFGEVVDMSEIKCDHDAVWEDYVERLGDHDKYKLPRESAELHKVAERGRNFFTWLSKRPEDHVLMCSHAAFMRCLWNFGLDEEVPMQMPQIHDTRDGGEKNHPVVQYMGDSEFEASLRHTYENCEMRSMVIAFPK